MANVLAAFYRNIFGSSNAPYFPFCQRLGAKILCRMSGIFSVRLYVARETLSWLCKVLHPRQDQLDFSLCCNDGTMELSFLRDCRSNHHSSDLRSSCQRRFSRAVSSILFFVGTSGIRAIRGLFFHIERFCVRRLAHLEGRADGHVGRRICICSAWQLS